MIAVDPSWKLTQSELTSIKNALCAHMGIKPGEFIPDAVRDAALDVLKALYRTRFGPAPGTTGYQPYSGKTATRYYDTEFKCLRWVVLDNASIGNLAAERCDKLPGHSWDIRESDWLPFITPYS